MRKFSSYEEVRFVLLFLDVLSTLWIVYPGRKIASPGISCVSHVSVGLIESNFETNKALEGVKRRFISKILTSKDNICIFVIFNLPLRHLRSRCLAICFLPLWNFRFVIHGVLAADPFDIRTYLSWSGFLAFILRDSVFIQGDSFLIARVFGLIRVLVACYYHMLL